ncbi:MAG: pentapeptide repeat-containing protein [Phormidesmis sp. RL_2_1]|nr:pentapeptide repeat-containing protein [Phormidesmis sp. RL_2_1]
MAPFSAYSHLSRHRLEQRIQAIPTWLVALAAVLPLSAAIIFIREDPAAPLTWKLALRLLLDNAEAIALAVAVVLYLKGAPDRKTQKHYEAWRVIDTAAAANVTTSYARYQALQDLHRDGVSLQWLEAPNTNLAGICLPKANLQACNLAGANLQNANLRGANLQEANLAGADLSHADLAGSDLTAANLKGTNLRSAVMWKARLWEADLSQAEMRWADIHQEQLDGAKLSETIMPDGRIYNLLE